MNCPTKESVRRPTFVDLFCGAGGLSLGLLSDHWHCLLANDMWSDAVATYGHNFPSHQLVSDPIELLTNDRLGNLLPETPDWIVGGPPCQGFSTVGKRRKSDPRNALISEFSRVVAYLRPGGFLIENVLGLKDMRFEREVLGLFESIKYRVKSYVLTAADFGVPQLRRRVVFVGTRLPFELPVFVPTHRESQYITVWDAIGDLPPVKPGETKTSYDREPTTDCQREMRARSTYLQGHTASAHPYHLVKAISFIPDGGNRLSIPPEYQPRSGFHNSYSRLNSRLPAVAVTSNMGKPSATRCIHPTQDRGLTAREGARLQTFPDSFHFYGGVVSQRLQIANAVPPRLAGHLARTLRECQAAPEADADQPALTACA